jgi:hypothetical protein
VAAKAEVMETMGRDSRDSWPLLQLVLCAAHDSSLVYLFVWGTVACVCHTTYAALNPSTPNPL